MKKNLLILYALLVCAKLSAQQYYGNEVKLLDSTVPHPTELVVKEPILGKAWLKVDGQRYEFKDVLHYQDKNGYFKVEQSQLGTGAFPTIYKLEKKGSRIDLYSRESWAQSAPMYSPGIGGAGGWTGGYGYKVKAWYYAKGAGKIWPLKMNNIGAAVGDNPDAMARVEKARKARKTGTILTVVGVAATITGTALTSKNIKEENSKPPPYDTKNPLKVVSPMFFVGIALVPGAAYFKKGNDRKLREAIDIYNR
ncbi:MAG: hypothetical protein GC192_22220 [Bacteroidetes bacterium]|nr:hypothetical protein [Bacteroidota bacterium]